MLHFDKSYQINRYACFQTTFKKSHKFYAIGVILFIHRRVDENHLKFAMIIPKKVVRRSIDRHALKRIGRECMRIHQASFIGANMILLMKLKLSPAQLKESLQSLFKKMLIPYDY